MTTPWSTSVDQEAFKCHKIMRERNLPPHTSQTQRHSLDSSALMPFSLCQQRQQALVRCDGNDLIGAVSDTFLSGATCSKVKKRGVRRASMSCAISVKMDPSDLARVTDALLKTDKNVTSRCEADPMFSVHQLAFLDDLLRESAALFRLMRAHGPDVNSEPYICPGSDAQPWMREVVGSWMCDVSKELRFELDVHPRAMQLFDRFLLRRALKRTHLQLIGAACMLVASKLVEFSPVTLTKLVQYSDNSLTREQILNAELLLCATLDYDICIITALDFVFPVCHLISEDVFGAYQTQQLQQRRCTLRSLTCELIRDQIHSYDSLAYSPSEWAAGSLLAVFCHRFSLSSPIMAQLTGKPQSVSCSPEQINFSSALITILRIECTVLWQVRGKIEQLAFGRGLGKAVLSSSESDDTVCYDTTPNNVRDVNIV